MAAGRCASPLARRKSTTAFSLTPSGTAACPLRLRCFQSAAAPPPPDATLPEGASPLAAPLAARRAAGFLALALPAQEWSGAGAGCSGRREHGRGCWPSAAAGS